MAPRVVIKLVFHEGTPVPSQYVDSNFMMTALNTHGEERRETVFIIEGKHSQPGDAEPVAKSSVMMLGPICSIDWEALLSFST